METHRPIHLLLSWALCAFLLFAACRSGRPKYEPDSVHLGTDGILYLHSAEKAAVFRFSLAEMRYLPRINLAPDSLHVAYSAADHVLYVGYADGSLTRVDLASGLTEEPFADLSGGRPMGLTTAGSYLYALTFSWHRVFAADGTLADERVTAGDASEAYVWSDANQRIR